MNSLLKKLLFVLIIVNIFLSAWLVLHKDILFHTDIARDFLLVEDIVKNHHITLIGPRSGGVSGVFHGPLWLYLQVPAFIIGHGDPAVVGIFWLLLSICAIAVVYYFARKIFDGTAALVAAALFSVYSIATTSNLFNPFGAVLLAPFFFYWLWSFMVKLHWPQLLLAIFTLGVIIQFQMAWGVPILILTTLMLAVFLYKKRRLQYFLTYLVLLIPLSTFIVFELKHHFLQLNSVIKYLSHPPAYTKVQFLPFILSRMKGYLFDGLGLTAPNYWLLLVPIVAVFIYFYLVRRNKFSKEYKLFYQLFFYLYTGYWLIVTLFYRDVIWSYYYWPFLPIVVIVLASAYRFIPQRIYVSILTVLIAVTLVQGIKDASNYQANRTKNASTWRYYHDIAEKIYSDAPAEFGYYIYTPDLLGYSFIYSMSYTQKEFPDKKSFPFGKKQTTYLLVAPPPDDKPFLTGNWWRSHQVNINKKPVAVFKYPSKFVIEKYELTPEEQKIASDPNLVQNLLFR